jgi:ribonuclease HI
MQASVGNTTNNATFFFALEQGLEIMIREGHVNVTVEGDSTLVIGTDEKITVWNQNWQANKALVPSSNPSKNTEAPTNSVLN